MVDKILSDALGTKWRGRLRPVLAERNNAQRVNPPLPRVLTAQAHSIRRIGLRLPENVVEARSAHEMNPEHSALTATASVTVKGSVSLPCNGTAKDAVTTVPAP